MATLYWMSWSDGRALPVRVDVWGAREYRATVVNPDRVALHDDPADTARRLELEGELLASAASEPDAVHAAVAHAMVRTRGYPVAINASRAVRL